MSTITIDIINNYFLLDKIGSNTFSELYLIKEKSTGHIFTAKISFQTYESTIQLRDKLLYVRQLNHPSLLQYIGYSPTNFYNEPKPVVISQYMPNKSLENILYKESNIGMPLYWDDTRKLINIYGIASAMSYLHSNKIIHGYLYPTNILMDEHIFPKVTDYQPLNLHDSNSKAINTQTSIYIAPELYGNSTYSKEGDVYAFSIIVYEIITNTKPFNNLSFNEVLTKVASGFRPEIPSKIPEPYKKLIEKCWSQNPSDRPSFEQIVNCLRDTNEFITGSVKKADYENYIDYLDYCQNNSEENNRYISVEEFIERKMEFFKPIRITEEKSDQNQNKKKEEFNSLNNQIKQNELFNFSDKKAMPTFSKSSKKIDFLGLSSQNDPIDLLDSANQKSSAKSHNESFDFKISNVGCPITPQQLNCLQMSFSSFVKNGLKNPKEQSKQILKICNHPLLLKDNQNQNTIKLNNTFDFNLSGKMIILDKLLSKLKKDEQRVIILTDTSQILEIIRTHLVTKDYAFIQFDNNVRSEKRQEAIDKFNSANSFFVFLCNFKSGLHGINLTNADYVIIYDSNEPTNCIINKLKDNGIGQKKKAEIIRLVTSQSYEEVIINYLDNDKDQKIGFTQKLDKFLRLGAYFAFKMYDTDSIISISEKIQDISNIYISDIESSDFWEKLIPNNYYFNPNNEPFVKSLNSEIYIDKSEMIFHINKLINTEQNCLCVTRPRRFGKTMAVKMLSAYYSKGCDSSELFAGLKVSKMDGFYDHLNKHNVIYIDIQMFALTYNGKIENLFSFITTNILEEIKLTFPDIKGDNLIYALKETNQKFIIFIDEWDVIFKKYKDNKNIQRKYIDFLIPFTKGPFYQKQIELVYMTGILPIKKHDINSSLNAFTECTMLNPIFMAPYTGFTEEEVKDLCIKNQFDYNEMNEWYNGYVLNNFHIYNPKSVIDAITSRKIKNYWSKTGSFESLKDYISMNFDGLRDSIIKMLDNENIKIDDNSFQNDENEIKNKDDVLTFFVHVGYLAYDETKNEVFIPNNELMSVFFTTIKQCDWPAISEAIKQSDELLDATLSMNSDKVCEIIRKVHYQSTSVLKYNNENSLSCVISIAFYTARKFYFISREMPLGKGFLDIVFLPKPGTNKPAILFELKWNEKEESAIDQIEQKKYSEHLSQFTSNLIIAGINYVKNRKEYQCIIRKYKE